MREDDEDKPVWESDLSCTFCGPGTWAVWDVVSEDGVFFVCEKHHVEMSESKIIKLERRMDKNNWKRIKDPNIFERYLDDLIDIDLDDYE